jgi:hypothetical protein
MLSGMTKREFKIGQSLFYKGHAKGIRYVVLARYPQTRGEAHRAGPGNLHRALSGVSA